MWHPREVGGCHGNDEQEVISDILIRQENGLAIF